MEPSGACFGKKLNFDEACVSLRSQSDETNLWLYTLSSDCHFCPYKKIRRLDESHNSSIIVNSAVPQTWRVIKTTKAEEYISASNKNGLYCQFAPEIGQYGVYDLNIYEINSSNSCNFRTIKTPVNEYTVLAVAAGAILLLLSSLTIIKWIRSCANKRSTEATAADGTVKNSGSKRRVRSIDTVRGMSILLMIFVNNGAGGYQYLEHATWDGLNVGDLVFPCFMWIMGVCIPLSICSQLSRGASRLAVCRAIVKRSLNLFLIGVSLNTLGGRTQLEKIRIFGVLQRFSVAYLVAGISYTVLTPFKTSLRKRPLGDIADIWAQWVVALLVLGGHCAVTFFWPVPGCPSGYLGPGGRHADGKYLNCTGGAAGYVDKVLLGVDHIYQFPTANSVYGSGPFDPEGLLGSLTSIFQVFLGIQAGQIMREFKSSEGRLLRWFIWAVLLGVPGVALHFTQIIPINKNLWSISFVLVTTGISLMCLIFCYIVVDVLEIWEGGPFRVPGMNALLMYVGHQIFWGNFPFHWRLGEMNTHAWLLGENLWCVGIWCAIAYMYHRKRIYLTL